MKVRRIGKINKKTKIIREMMMIESQIKQYTIISFPSIFRWLAPGLCSYSLACSHLMLLELVAPTEF